MRESQTSKNSPVFYGPPCTYECGMISHVYVYVCLSVLFKLLAFECFALQMFVFDTQYLFRIPRPWSSIKVIEPRSRSYERN